ncbi:MAG: serine/threonine-protein kinase [Planctomycetota bacterium]
MESRLVAKQKGEVVEGQRILAEIGRGAASIVYLVQDQKSKQIGALKHVQKHDPKDQRFLDQAEIEYQIASQLDHPVMRKIPKRIKKGSLLNTKELYLLMELVDGQAMDLLPPKTFEDAVDLFLQVAKGLAHMHERGFVHADMKPNNVIVIEGNRAKIIDLGQSCKVGTVKPRIQGTPDYIAPEQVHRREITGKTDIYNLGATMYWVLTRQKIPTALASGDSLVGSIDDNLMEKPRPAMELNKRIPQRLNDLIMSCVEVNADLRPRDMRDVADTLELVLGQIRAAANKSSENASIGKSNSEAV